jgi:hypothetical protein
MPAIDWLGMQAPRRQVSSWMRHKVRPCVHVDRISYKVITGLVFITILLAGYGQHSVGQQMGY